MQGRTFAVTATALSAGKLVGEITSGHYLPRWVIQSRLPHPQVSQGQKLEVEIRGKPYPAVVVNVLSLKSQGIG